MPPFLLLVMEHVDLFLLNTVSTPINGAPSIQEKKIGKTLRLLIERGYNTKNIFCLKKIKERSTIFQIPLVILEALLMSL